MIETSKNIDALNKVYSERKTITNKKASKSNDFKAFCWPTRTRTLNIGTKNRCVTITP